MISYRSNETTGFDEQSLVEAIGSGLQSKPLSPDWSGRLCQRKEVAERHLAVYESVLR